MKKSIFTLAIAITTVILSSFTLSARSADNSLKQDIESVIENYRGNNNFEVVKIGSWMMNIARMNDKSGVTANLKSMIVVDYEDCANNVKSGFTIDILRAAKGCSKLMEIQDEDEKVTIMGTVSEDGNTVSNPMLISDSGALVCFFGHIATSDIAELNK